MSQLSDDILHAEEQLLIGQSLDVILGCSTRDNGAKSGSERERERESAAGLSLNV